MITKIIYRVHVLATNKNGRRYSFCRDFEDYDLADEYYNGLYAKYNANFEISLFQVTYHSNYLECLPIINDFNWL